MARSQRLSIYFLVITGLFTFIIHYILTICYGLFTFIMDYYIYYRYMDNPYTWIIYIIVGLYAYFLVMIGLSYTKVFSHIEFIKDYLLCFIDLTVANKQLLKL